MCCLCLDIKADDYVLHPFFGNCVVKSLDGFVILVEILSNGIRMKVPYGSVMLIRKP